MDSAGVAALLQSQLDSHGFVRSKAVLSVGVEKKRLTLRLNATEGSDSSAWIGPLEGSIAFIEWLVVTSKDGIKYGIWRTQV